MWNRVVGVMKPYCSRIRQRGQIYLGARTAACVALRIDRDMMCCSSAYLYLWKQGMRRQHSKRKDDGVILQVNVVNKDESKKKLDRVNGRRREGGSQTNLTRRARVTMALVKKSLRSLPFTNKPFEFHSCRGFGFHGSPSQPLS